MTDLNLTASSKLFASAPLVMSKELFRKARRINYSMGYEIVDSIKDKGVSTEQEVYELLQLLNVDEVFLTPSVELEGKKHISYLDSDLKVDVVARVGDVYLGWQIKSGVTGAKAHLKREKVYFQKKGYPTPGVIMINHKGEGSKYWKVKLLNQIATLAGVPVKKEVALAIEKWKGVKVLKDIPLGILQPPEVRILHTLGLVRVQGDKTISI